MPEMKDSSISSFGAIPKAWELVKLKTILTLRSERNTGGRELLSVYLDRGVISYADSTGMQVHKPSQDLSNYQNVYVGDFVLNNQQAWGGSVGVSKYDGIISPAYFVYRLSGGCNPRYMDYLLRDACMYQQYETASRGVGTIQRNLYAPWLLNCFTILPPLSDQCAIAAFLDSKCAEIDALVADIQSQIDTLEQYKRSVITEAVTKGLNLDAEIRDSGIQWIGIMPAHWKCIRGKYVLRYVQRPVQGDDGVITCFRDGEVTLRCNRREDGFTMADKEIGYQGIDVGDLVVHGMDGFAGAIGISDSRGKASPVLNVLETTQNKRYIMYFLRSMAYSNVFLALATGIRVRSCDLRWNKLSELFYPIPPLDEQGAIVAYIDDVVQKTNAVIADKMAQLETLEKYKKSLIFEYVTGKKEVPKTVAVVGIDPHALLLAKIADTFGVPKGKVVNQKLLYLCDVHLGLGLSTQYYRYDYGPFDLQLDSYIDTLVSNGWYKVDNRDRAKILVKEKNHAEICKMYGDQFSAYESGIRELVQYFEEKRVGEIERFATLFAAWNDFIIDGILAPSDDQIIDEVLTNWEPTKTRFSRTTWQNTLAKMKRDQIVPKGLGLHTLPKPKGGKIDA